MRGGKKEKLTEKVDGFLKFCCISLPSTAIETGISLRVTYKAI
jgi:hypothetical protein